MINPHTVVRACRDLESEGLVSLDLTEDEILLETFLHVFPFRKASFLSV